MTMYNNFVVKKNFYPKYSCIVIPVNSNLYFWVGKCIGCYLL